MTAKGSSLAQPHLPLSHSGRPLQVSSSVGDSLGRFPGRGMNRRAWWMVAIPGLLLAGSFLAYGTWRWYYGYTRFGTVAATAWSQPYLLTGALVAAVLMLWLIQRRSQGRRMVELFENGVRISTRRQKDHLWHWAEIRGLTSGSIESRFLGLPLNRKNWLTIYPKTGGPVTLDDRIQDLPSLTHQLKPLFFSSRMPALRTDFYADRWISFGPLAIHRQALRVKKKLIPWKLVRDIRVQSGSLVITHNGKRAFRFPIRNITNLEMMIAIIQEGVIP